MPVLTDLAAAQVKRGVKTLYGKILTRPALLVSDGLNAIYACDVDIGQYDVTGKIDQYKDSLKGLPGQKGWNLGDDLIYNTILHNVALARNSAETLKYADVGSPVILNRSNSGQWEITGFAQEMPGTYKIYPVHLGDMTIGTVLDMSIEGRLLSLGELGTLGVFGETPLGASGIFIGGTLTRIV